ncbi:unnamed protein product [Urochloa decumbens]|uniref:Glutamate receptor n=1 Tax=Urochloa decumbens TaxID=240449 RepID=A0ABC9E6D3_9POAL
MMRRMETLLVTLPTSLLLLCFLLFVLFGHRPAAGTELPVPVRVGVIINLASATGKRLQTSIRMAVEDYYSMHPNSSTRVELHFRHSPGDAIAAISAAEELVTNAQVHAVIGPETPAEAELVATVGSRAHIPVLSYSDTATPISASGTPFLVRTCADDSFLAAPVADILGSFAWRGAVLVHEDSRTGTGIVPALVDVGVGIARRVAVPVDASDDRLDAVLYRAMSKTTTRIFVVHMSPSLARRMFRRAKKAGMMSQGYVWIATASGLGDEDRLSADDIDAMQGVVIVRPHVRPTIQANNFAARFKARLSKEVAGSQEIHGPSLPLLWAYDTAWAVAAAAEAAEISVPALQTSAATSSTGVSATGETLLKAVLDTTFDGLAGKFRLVERQLEMPAYEIVNVVADGTRIVGFWTEHSRMSQDMMNPSSQGLKQIIWPGEQSEQSHVPKGWAVSPSGLELVVSVPVKHGFNQFVDVSDDPTTGRPKITGYCIDVFDAVMKALPSPVSYQYVPFNGSSDSYDQLVRLVPQQKADVVVGDVTITSSRMGEVDYTMPFTESGWSMVVAVQTGRSTSMFFFLKPLTASLWLASFAFFVFTGFVVWVIEHRINPEFRGTPLQQLGLIFYYAFSTLVFAHREKLESNLSRFVVIIWVFVVLILTSSYTASLTSMLTVQQLEPMVTDVKELIRRGDYVGYQEGSFMPSELKKMNFDESKLRVYSTPEQYAEALSKGSSNGGVAAIFDEIPYLKLFLSQYCDGYAMVGPIYKDAGFGFVFPKGSPMAPDVSRAIVSLTEGGDMALIERKWFGDPGACDSQGSGMGTSSLSFWSFSGLFLVTGVASGLMLVVNLATFVYRERRELSAAEPGGRSMSLRRLRAWLQHYDRKDTRSPSFKQWENDGSARSGVEAEKTGATKGESIRDFTAPAARSLGGSGDSDIAAAASSPGEEVANAASTSFEQRMEEAAVLSKEIQATSAPYGEASLKSLLNCESRED